MKKAYGFTIVELLIVIVVIAILASISVAAYSNISNRANDSAVQSDLKNLAGKIQEYRVLNNSLPITGSNSAVMPDSMTFPANKQAYYSTGPNLYYCVVPGGDDARFALTARSKSGKIFVHNGSSFQEYTESAFSSGNNVCQGSGFTITETGFEYHYGRNANATWSTWTNG